MSPLATFTLRRFGTLLLSASLALALGACASAPGRAPVEERSPIAVPSGPTSTPPSTPRSPSPSPAMASQPAGASPPSAVGVGGAAARVPQAPVPAAAGVAGTATGTYIVKPGDTLIRIGLDHGQNWRDIARWSGIDNPNLIEVGQVLRVAPPVPEAAVASTRPVAAAGRLESRPLEPRASDTTSPSAAAGSTAPPAPVAPTPASPLPPAAASPRSGDDAVEWAWPAAGSVVLSFDEAKGVKGLSIAGKAGDPVWAAGDGRVVYAGSGLRGYGNLVIVKHNATFLTAYAHNQTLLVKEDQTVRRGQKIAEMGSTDADQVKLHFEVRRLGKPVDPARLLPAR